MKNNLTEEQQKELEILSAELEAEAIQMKLDYEKNPTEESGSVVVIHQNSPFLDKKYTSIEEWSKLRRKDLKTKYKKLKETENE